MMTSILTLEPSVLGERLCVEVGLLVVALEEGRSSAVDLSRRRVVGGEVSGVRDVDELMK